MTDSLSDSDDTTRTTTTPDPGPGPGLGLGVGLGTSVTAGQDAATTTAGRDVTATSGHTYKAGRDLNVYVSGPVPTVDGQQAGHSTPAGQSTPSASSTQPRFDLRRRGLPLAGILLITTLVVGLLARCDSRGSAIPPSAVTTSAACPGLPPTVFVGPGGLCNGVADLAGQAMGFGRDQRLLTLQRQIFDQNAADLRGGALTGRDLTVIWLGQLSAADDRSHDSELQQLQGLYLAQLRRPRGNRIHLVITDAGADMGQAGRVADLIVSNRDSFHGRVVAVGGGASRAVTRAAISKLLGAGVPFIAPALTGDWFGAGTAFINQPGFLQMSPPNQDWARSAIGLVARYTPGGRKRSVIIYTKDNPELYTATHAPPDEYTTSLARDVHDEANRNPRTQAVPTYVSDPGQLTDAICNTPADTSMPLAVFFAARWTDFRKPQTAATSAITTPGALDPQDFVHGVTSLCAGRRGGPALIISSDNVTRFMTDDSPQGRGSVPEASWPMAYYLKGIQCSALRSAADAGLSQAQDLLGLARSTLHACGAVDDAGQVDPSAPDQLGESVSLTWDAAALADQILPTATPGATLELQSLQSDRPFGGVSGTLSVRGGEILDRGPTEIPALAAGPIPDDGPVHLYCVERVGLRGHDTGRSVNFCDRKFGPLLRRH